MHSSASAICDSAGEDRRGSRSIRWDKGLAAARRPCRRAPGSELLKALAADRPPLAVVVGADDVVPLPGAAGDKVVAGVGPGALAPVDGLARDRTEQLVVGRDREAVDLRLVDDREEVLEIEAPLGQRVARPLAEVLALVRGQDVGDGRVPGYEPGRLLAAGHAGAEALPNFVCGPRAGHDVRARRGGEEEGEGQEHDPSPGDGAHW